MSYELYVKTSFFITIIVAQNRVLSFILSCVARPVMVCQGGGKLGIVTGNKENKRKETAWYSYTRVEEGNSDSKIGSLASGKRCKHSLNYNLMK